MSIEDKAVATQNDDVGKGGKYSEFRVKYRQHVRKWWWAHLLLVVALTALGVPLTVFFAVPGIAQTRINHALLTVQGISAENSTPTSYVLGINSTIHADNSDHANIAPFRGEMYLTDLEPHTPFVFVNFPETSSDTVSTVNISQLTPITNLAAFTTFNKVVLINDTVRVTVFGNTKVQVNGISHMFPVNFQKTITLNGLRNFNGTTISQGKISLTPDAQGNNFKGFVTIPNPSILSFDIGNVTFDTFLDGENIGPTFLDNVNLVPGLTVNNFTMRANISQPPVLVALGKKPACETGILPFVLRGKDVVNNGQHIPYFANSLGSTSQTVPIDIGSIIKNSLNLTVPCS